jgi:hypothetical protein
LFWFPCSLVSVDLDLDRIAQEGGRFGRYIYLGYPLMNTYDLCFASSASKLGRVSAGKVSLLEFDLLELDVLAKLWDGFGEG